MGQILPSPETVPTRLLDEFSVGNQRFKPPQPGGSVVPTIVVPNRLFYMSAIDNFSYVFTVTANLAAGAAVTITQSIALLTFPPIQAIAPARLHFNVKPWVKNTNLGLVIQSLDAATAVSVGSVQIAGPANTVLSAGAIYESFAATITAIMYNASAVQINQPFSVTLWVAADLHLE